MDVVDGGAGAIATPPTLFASGGADADVVVAGVLLSPSTP